jgi:hypothetical protein
MMQNQRKTGILSIVFTILGLVRLVYLPQLRLCTIPNVTFCVYSAGNRSGPGILRSLPVKIISTAIRTCTPPAYYPIEMYGL